MADQLIFLIVIIVLAVIVWRSQNFKACVLQRQNDPALNILHERYAQEEINTEEFARKSKTGE